MLFRSLVFTFAGILIFVFSAGAAQDTYDIDLKEIRPAQTPKAGAAKNAFDLDLKELKPAPARRDTLPQKPRPAKSASSKLHPKSGQESSYTVRPGDSLFLILIRQYGLSNRAAGQLIPDVRQRNGIHETQKLTVGQRLIIPLPPKAHKSSAISVEKTLPPPLSP